MNTTYSSSSLFRKIGLMVTTIVLVGVVAGVTSIVRAQQGQTNEMQTTGQYKHTFQTNLTGQAEVPPVQTNARGTMMVRIPQDEQRLPYILRVQNVPQVTAAHLHCAERGQNGPAIVTLYSTNQPRNISGVLSEGVITVEDILSAGESCEPRIDTMAHLVQAMREGRVYVNVHNRAHPDGVIRGQLTFGGDMRERRLDIDGVTVQELADSPAGTKSFIVTIETDLLRELGSLLERWSRELRTIIQ